MGLLDPISRVLSLRGRRARRMWAARGHAHIEIRRVDLDQIDRFAERLEEKLFEHHAVRWVEAVGNLGRVVVSFDEGAASPDEFVDSVEEVEEEFGVSEEPFAAEEQLHPADIEPIVRGIAEIGGAAIGVGVSTFRRLSRLPPLPLVGVAASALSVFEHQPRVPAPRRDRPGEGPGRGRPGVGQRPGAGCGRLTRGTARRHGPSGGALDGGAGPVGVVAEARRGAVGRAVRTPSGDGESRSPTRAASRGPDRAIRR